MFFNITLFAFELRLSDTPFKGEDIHTHASITVTLSSSKLFNVFPKHSQRGHDKYNNLEYVAGLKRVC